MEDLWASDVSSGDPSQVFQSTKHDRNPISVNVVPCWFLALLLTKDAGACPFVFYCFSVKFGIVSSVSDQPTDIRQTAQHCPRTDVVADLTGGHELVEARPLLRPIRRPRRPSPPQTGRCFMGLQIGGVDHQRVVVHKASERKGTGAPSGRRSAPID